MLRGSFISYLLYLKVMRRFSIAAFVCFAFFSFAYAADPVDAVPLRIEIAQALAAAPPGIALSGASFLERGMGVFTAPDGSFVQFNNRDPLRNWQSALAAISEYQRMAPKVSAVLGVAPVKDIEIRLVYRPEVAWSAHVSGVSLPDPVTGEPGPRQAQRLYLNTAPGKQFDAGTVAHELAHLMLFARCGSQRLCEVIPSIVSVFLDPGHHVAGDSYALMHKVVGDDSDRSVDARALSRIIRDVMLDKDYAQDPKYAISHMIGTEMLGHMLDNGTIAPGQNLLPMVEAIEAASRERGVDGISVRLGFEGGFPQLNAAVTGEFVLSMRDFFTQPEHRADVAHYLAARAAAVPSRGPVPPSASPISSLPQQAGAPFSLFSVPGFSAVQPSFADPARYPQTAPAMRLPVTAPIRTSPPAAFGTAAARPSAPKPLNLGTGIIKR